MFGQTIRITVISLLFAAVPVAHSFAQGSADAGRWQKDVSQQVDAPPTLPAGTAMTIFIADTITSRHNRAGQPVVAMTRYALLDAAGEVVIPAGAIFLGVILDITADGEGRLALSFDRVAFGGNTYSLQARVMSLPTRRQRRGNTAGDAAQVGVGAVVGGIAGRLIGGNRRGTIIGAVTGAGVGAGMAAATRDEDIVLDGGAPIQLVLTAPFVLYSH